MSGPTPGPWEVETVKRGPDMLESNLVKAPKDPSPYYVADTFIPDSANGGRPREERDANARLIAAAPDLLAYAECQEAWDRFEFHEPPGFKLDDVGAVCCRHGWDENVEPSVRRFLASLRRAALAKANSPP